MSVRMDEASITFNGIEPPEPGERCALCNRRRNKKRTESEPAETKQIRITLPKDDAEYVEEAFDILQEVVGADPYSYPRGQLLKAMLVVTGQHREEVKRYFDGSE